VFEFELLGVLLGIAIYSQRKQTRVRKLNAECRTRCLALLPFFLLLTLCVFVWLRLHDS